ncbi:MAG: hypothetical protein AAF497_04685 [Planctomycetota bacterium]
MRRILTRYGGSRFVVPALAGKRDEVVTCDDFALRSFRLKPGLRIKWNTGVGFRIPCFGDRSYFTFTILPEMPPAVWL